MMDDELKSKVQKNVREKIAISNIRKEVDMDKKKNRKIVYTVLSSCAVAMICAVAVVNSGSLNGNKDKQIADLANDKYAAVEEKQNLKLELNINKINPKEGLLKIDADIKTLNDINIPYFEILRNIKIPNDMDGMHGSAIYVKDEKTKKYDKLYNYEYSYLNTKDNLRSINIAFSDTNKPLRDYYFDDKGKTSNINGVELRIYQYEDSYMTIFKFNGYNFDIETNGITETELVELLQSIVVNYVK